VRLLSTLVFAAAVLAAPAAFAEDVPLTAEQTAVLDKEFNAAVEAARASLPVFWRQLAENPGGPNDYGLKVTFHNAQGQTEEVWLQDIKRDGKRIVGRLNYDPQTLPQLRRTDIVPIREADIVDWSFKWGRKRYGEFTTRVLAKAHPADSAKTLAALADNPIPADAAK